MAVDRVLLPSSVLPSHYTLTLTPDLSELRFLGHLAIKVNVVESVQELTLHSKEIQVTKVTVTNADGSSPSLVGINYNIKLTTVTFLFDGDIKVGPADVVIEFTGILNGDMAGFYKSTYTDADGNKKIMASTQFEALDARRAFPCWDEPARKATFTVIMIVPAHLTALSNMPEVESLHLGKGLKRVTFGVSPVMSTYLLAWAVGEFDSVSAITKGGVTIRVIAPPGRAKQGMFALDAGVRALDFFDDFFQVPYPLPKLDMLCVTEFAMGAMENWGLVTYRENALMIDEEKASSAVKQRVAIVVAHELAHQWFGNLVTMAWWDGLWLNEGFASFMEHFCIDSLYPDYQIWDQFVTGAFMHAQALDGMRSSHPIIVPIKHAEEVEQVFDAISYCKGSTVVNMVYHTLGYEKFRAGLQLYMKRHAYGNTETRDLWNAWSEVSQVDVTAMMDTWTTRMGYPSLTVVSEDVSGSSLAVTLKQSWFLADGSVTDADFPEGKRPVWHIPLLFATASSVSEKATIMNQEQQTFTIAAGTGTDGFLKINAGQRALVRVNYSPTLLARLSPAIRNGQLSDVDVASLLLDAYALLKADQCSVESVVQVLKSIDSANAGYIVWTALSGVLSGLYLILEAVGGPAYEHFMAFAKAKVTEALAVVGWENRATDEHTDKLLRTCIIGLLDKFAIDDEGVVGECKRRFWLSLESQDGSGDASSAKVLPAEYKTTVYRIVLASGGLKEYEAVLRTFTGTDDNQEKKYAMHSLGATADTALKLRTLDWAVKSGDVKLQDFFYPIEPVASTKAGCDLAWQYYQTNFQFIKDKLAKASPSLMGAVISYSVGRYCTNDKADEIEAFFAANPLPSSSRVVSQLLERMRTNAKLLQIIRGTSEVANASFWN